MKNTIELAILLSNCLNLLWAQCIKCNNAIYVVSGQAVMRASREFQGKVTRVSVRVNTADIPEDYCIKSRWYRRGHHSSHQCNAEVILVWSIIPFTYYLCHSQVFA